MSVFGKEKAIVKFFNVEIYYWLPKRLVGGLLVYLHTITVYLLGLDI